jgi:hypothetical protein
MVKGMSGNPVMSLLARSLQSLGPKPPAKPSPRELFVDDIHDRIATAILEGRGPRRSA